MSERKNTGPILQSLLDGAAKLFWRAPEIQVIGHDGEPKTVSCSTAEAAASVVLGWFRGGHNAEDHTALKVELDDQEYPGYTLVSAWETIFSPLAALATAWVITQLDSDTKIEDEGWDRTAAEINKEANPEG